MALFHKERAADSRRKTSVGVHFGTIGAYVTTIKGESFDQKLMEADVLGSVVRRAYHAVTGLGGPEVLFKNAVLPKDIEPAKIGEAVRWQFYDVEAPDYEFVYKRTDFSPDGNLTVICAAVPRRMIDDFCRENSGIYTCLDVRPFALWRGFRFTHPGDGPTVLLARWPEGLTVVGGRKEIEFVREMPASATLDSERMRTVDYFRRAFDAPDANVVELEGEESAYLVSAGYALAPFYPGQINILPEQHRRVRPTEFKKPQLSELVAAGLVITALTVAAPYAAARYYDAKAKEYRAAAASNAPAAQEAASLRSEISKYQEWADVVSGHKITPYMAMVGDVRYAVPPSVMLDDLEIGGGAAPAAASGPATPIAGGKAVTVQPGPTTGGTATGASGQPTGQTGAGTPVRAGQPILTDQVNPTPVPASGGKSTATAGTAGIATPPVTAQPTAPSGGTAAGQLVGSGGQTPSKGNSGGSQQAGGINVQAGQTAPAQNVRALYVPMSIRLSGKAKTLELVGVFADNLSQLPYVESVTTESVEYDGVFYIFRISVKLKVQG
ncbi:MAG: hypothetical protein ACPLSY_04925 [Moorellaceae bacterium]